MSNFTTQKGLAPVPDPKLPDPLPQQPQKPQPMPQPPKPVPMGKAVLWINLGKGGKGTGLYDVGGVKHNTRAKPYDKPGAKLTPDQKSEEKKYPGVWSHRAQPRNPDDPHPVHRGATNRDVKDLKSGKHPLARTRTTAPDAPRSAQRKARRGNVKGKRNYLHSLARDNRKNRGTYGGLGPGKTIDPRSPKGIKMDEGLPYNRAYKKKWEAKYGRKLPPRQTPRGAPKMPGTNSTRAAGRTHRDRSRSVGHELIAPQYRANTPKPPKPPIRKGLGPWYGSSSRVERTKPELKRTQHKQSAKDRKFGFRGSTRSPGMGSHKKNEPSEPKTEHFRNIKRKKTPTWAERNRRAGFVTGTLRTAFPMISKPIDNVREYAKTKRLDLDPKPGHRAKEKAAATKQEKWRLGARKPQRDAAHKKTSRSVGDELIKPSRQFKPKKPPEKKKQFRPTTSSAPMGSMPKQKKDPFRPVKKSLDVLQDSPDKAAVMEKSRRLQLEFLRRRVWN